MTTVEIELNVYGNFWTDENEMIKELEEMGYEVLEVNGEYVSISAEEDDEEDKEFVLYLGHANTTMWVEKIKEI
jgi:hypothetical protein